jgi:hypothetical protein
MEGGFFFIEIVIKHNPHTNHRRELFLSVEH